MDILKEYSEKYSKEELTPDGLPTIEVQLKEIEEKDEELLRINAENSLKIYNREMVQRVKCLCLLKMDIPIFTNTLSLNKKNRDKLQILMHEYNDIEHDEIIKEFNEKIGDILDDKDTDISKLPIYNYN